MYLYMLQDHVLNMPGQEWRMRPENDEAKEFLNRAARTLVKHQYPETTRESEPKESLFKFTRSMAIGPQQEYIVRVLDMPGEWFQYPEKAIGADGTNILQKYLRDSQGLLCLVDPDSPEDEPMIAYLTQLLNDLYMQTRPYKVDKWLAFCLTKMDLPQHRPHLNDPASYVKQKLGSLIVTRILDYCQPGRVRFDYACSAVGYYHRPNGNQLSPERSNSGIDWFGQNIIYEVKHIRPFGLFEPLQWLFENGVGRV